MAKIKKNAFTPEEEWIYLAVAETMIQSVESYIKTFIVAHDATSTDRKKKFTFNISDQLLQNSDSLLNVALNHLQSPKDIEDFSEEHLARFRVCCGKLRNLRYNVLKINQTS